MIQNIDRIQPLYNLTTTADIVKDVQTILTEARRITTRAVNSTMAISGNIYLICQLKKRFVESWEDGEN